MENTVNGAIITILLLLVYVWFKTKRDAKIIKQKDKELEEKTLENSALEKKLNELCYTEYSEAKREITRLNHKTSESNIILSQLRSEIERLQTQQEAKDKQLKTTINKIAKNKEIINAIDYSIENFTNKNISFEDCRIPNFDKNYIEELLPSVMLKLNAMNIADLRKANNANNKEIEKVLTKYKDRYTTKTNKAVYGLMVIALRAELQNILIELKYEKLDKSIDTVKNVTSKYLAIASEGNQSIAPTLTKFIGELEYFFINAVNIEYNYYVKKEQAKQEQLILREQMRQEAEERKALEAERKKIQKEEEKYTVEIDKVNEKLQNAENQTEIDLLNARLEALQQQLADVEQKKEEVTKLQNGKAGTVYVISNLGSFGEDVFKVGMTRRLEPMDRVKELGDASVPFTFDVHSFIFSDDAVGLENTLHKILNANRLNKVNRRKEFFKVSIDDIEKIVLDIQPTAEFNKTMIAEEFKQSLSASEGYSDDFEAEDIDAE